MKHKLFCLIGPSSTGKDAIKKASGYPYLVSYRTRDKRVGEIEGDDGFFITEEEFLNEDPNNWIAQSYYDHAHYGVKKEQLHRLKKSHLIYVIDWDGYQDLEKNLKDVETVSIFVYSRLTVLKDRMMQQGRSQDEIERRLKKVKADLVSMNKCDYIIENTSTISSAVDQLKKIIDMETS